MTYVYDLDHRHDLAPEEITALVGGKAANLAVMASELGLPVPPGFVITTAACRDFLARGWPAGLDGEVKGHMKVLEERAGKWFGDPTGALLVSVRSGAPVSMPGMMDTILNLGLNAVTAQALGAAYGDERFAEDCYKRFTEMFTDVVGVASVPDDPWQQLRAAVEAVFRSWNSDRARVYRKHEGIADDLGTAVTVQAMVFGNLGPGSCTGVLFTRNPSTGERGLYGDVVFGAQGEDVVAGTHATENVAVLDERLPAVALELRRVARVLEGHFGDLCEIEFTVEQGRLWLLQVRHGKRSPQAALRIAVDMAEDAEFPLSREQAVRRVAPYLFRPPVASARPVSNEPALARGLPASPGTASGEIVTSAEDAEPLATAGHSLVLVRMDTSPEDVPAMALAAGIITSRGGLTSHAAVIARDWGIPAVVGAPVRVEGRTVFIGDHRLAAGDTVTVDGSTGEIFAGQVPSCSVVVAEAETLLAWAKEYDVDLGHPGARMTVPAPVLDAEVVADDVMRALAIKEVASASALATAVLSTPERVGLMLDELATEDLVRLSNGMASLTGAGRERGRELMAADREQWGAANTVAALDAFLKFDGPVKEIVTAWQLRDVDGQPVPNDHANADYDMAVLDRLTAVHEEVTRWLAPVAAHLGRFSVYAKRLDGALACAHQGDPRFVASPRVDSYHSAWFELHEDLIRLAGRTREKEVEAGRA